MTAIAGIVSIDLTRPKEKLSTMLSWCKPVSGTFAQKISQTHEFQNCSIGMIGTTMQMNEQGTIIVGLTGELLRKEKLVEAINARKKGNISSLLSDSILILRGYEILGVESFHLLEGDFSFFLLDQNKKELFIARDRQGTYDLYWSVSKNAIFFSSSMKALLATGLIAASPDLEALSSYLFLGYISQDKTPIQGVNRLIPGYFLQISLNGKMSVHSFWSFSAAFSKTKTRSFTETRTLFFEIREKIKQAVQERTSLDEQFASCLSGTVGSQVLEETLLEITKQPRIPSFSQTFIPYNKSQDAHSQPGITADKFLNEIVKMIWTLEMPISSPEAFVISSFADFCHTHNLAPFFDTAFDQEFHDYSTPLAEYLNNQANKAKKSPYSIDNFESKIFHALSFILPMSALRLLRRHQAKDLRIAFMEKKSVFSSVELKRVSPSLGKLFQPDLFFHQFYHLPRIHSFPASLFYLNFKTEVTDKVHTLRSKISLNKGLHPQTPFMDLELLEFLASLDDFIWASPDILSSFPQQLVKSPKKIVQPHPFETMLTWKDHPGMNTLLQALGRGLLIEGGFISSSWLEAALKKNDGRSFEQLYTLLIFELWMRLFIDLPLSSTNGDIPINDLLLIPPFTTEKVSPQKLVS